MHGDELHGILYQRDPRSGNLGKQAAAMERAGDRVDLAVGLILRT